MEQPQTTGMPVSQMENNNKKYWITGGIIALLAFGAFILLRDTTPPNNILPGDQNSLSISDQDPDAVAVLVRQVSFIQSGFIVIQDGTNGTAGKVLAVSNLFIPGAYTNKTIIMPLEPGASYFGTLYGDDGNGIFDATNDAPLTDATGNIVRVMFKARMSSTSDDVKG